MAKRVCPAEIEALPQALRFVEDMLEQNGCPMEISLRVCVAIEELFVNICYYAYPEETGELELVILPCENSVMLLLEDSGVPFDPRTRAEQTDIQAVAASEETGGFGLPIVRKVMDQLNYQYADGRNRLTMIKRW